MLYTLPKSYSQAGTKVDIPDSELKTKRNALGSTKAAIDQWLFENGYMQEDEYAAELAVAQEGIVNKKASSRKRQPDEVKRGLIQALYSCLLDVDSTANVTITNVERIVSFTVGDDTYEITLSKKRKPKA